MTPEAWVALGLGIATIAMTIIGAAWVVSAQVTRAATEFRLIGSQQTLSINELKLDVAKLNDVVALVAVQKEEIRSLRETEAQNTRRTDETFTRIFAIIDNLPKS
jgi:hypothetical protein